MGLTPERNIAGRWRQLAAVTASLNSSNKVRDGVLPYTRYVNRPLARPIVRAAFLLGISPNALTLISGALSVVSFGIIAVSTNIQPLHGIVLSGILLLAYAMDSADGRLSRVLGSSSPMGEWLDHSLDGIKLCFAHAACLAFLMMNSDMMAKPAALVGMVILAAVVGNFTANLLREKVCPASSEYVEQSKSSMRVLRQVLFTPLDYGVFCMIFILLPWPALFCLVYIAWGMAASLKALLSFVKTARLLQAANVSHKWN